MHPVLPLAFVGNLFGIDGIFILLAALLIFGRRLPDVGKNLGKTIVEFKKGLSGSYSQDEESSAAADAKKVVDNEPKRINRIAASTNSEDRAPRVRKTLPSQTEEV